MKYDQKQINRNSRNLMLEFFDHCHQVRTKNPDITRAVVFERWIIQKISGLQIACEQILEEAYLIGLSSAETKRKKSNGKRNKR